MEAVLHSDLARFEAVPHGVQLERFQGEMLAAYKIAARLPRTPTQTNIMDASDTHNRAIQFLADYYLKRSDWRESLSYWQSWKLLVANSGITSPLLAKNSFPLLLL